ncbi:MAG TPA: trypsin-like peptidase domain-containing protein, partial [Pirellulales bacterium]|nr:trypsin-like peptidase domain-containing protein [Pirellulales bacterium]
ERVRVRAQWRALSALLASLFLVGALRADPGAKAQGERSSQAAQDEQDEQDEQAEADLQFVSAMERVLGRAIARAEKSVVSIARKNRSSEYAPRDSQPDLLRPFSRHAGLVPTDPRDPDFVPNEFATGVVIDASGLVLTNSHVVDVHSDHFVTTVDRKVFEMKIKAADPRSDLAVLELKQPRQRGEHDFAPIAFGDASQLKKGQIVVALGNPYAIARDGQVSGSWGIISNLSRKAGSPPPRDQDGVVSDNTKMLHHFGTLIQTDAKLNLGTSGGALLNLRGEMIGLTTSLAAAAGYEQPAGYAIPVDETFRRVVETLKKGEEVEYGLLGIRPLSLDQNEVLKGLHGSKVEMVQRGDPAARYGIEIGDIVTHVDGQPIYDADGLRLHVGKLPPSATATLTILRGGQTLQKRVVLSKYPLGLPQVVTNRPPAWRGLHVDYSTVTRTTHLEIPDFSDPLGADGACVSAREVDTESPAWQAGLRPGTRISHVGPTPVETPEDFRRAVADKSGPVRLRIIGAGGELKVVNVAAQ